MRPDELRRKLCAERCEFARCHCRIDDCRVDDCRVEFRLAIRRWDRGVC
jgi:hypothetical protein